MIISDQKGKEFEGEGVFQDCRWDDTHLCSGVVTNKIAFLFFPEKEKKKSRF